MSPDEAITTLTSELNSTWVIVSAVLVIFMQAGFLFLEVGFSRGKNAGSGVAKILVNFSIATIAWWACGFALAFGGDGTVFGDSGFFLKYGSEISDGSLVPGPFTGSSAAFFIFQFAFCAVSLAIVWGTTLERLKTTAYAIFAVVFAAFIYPLIAHWGFGGGLFAEIGSGVQDFAGSSVVHLTGATAALAALLLLGPRRGQVRHGRPLAGDPGPLHAHLRARRADPLGRLVRLQRGLDARHQRRALRRGGRRHAARRRGGRDRRLDHDAC